VKKDALVGQFFHTFQDGTLQEQGEVLSRVSPELYLVRVFEWLLGAEFEQRIEPATNMVTWKFYSDRDTWQRAYEKYAHQRVQQ